MQNQSELSYRIEFEPIPLDAGFPIVGSGIGTQHRHADQPITFLQVHQVLEIGYCHSGSGIFIVADKVMQFTGGSVVIIAPSEPHLARSTPGTVSCWSWIYVDPVKLVGPVGDAKMLDPVSFAGPDDTNMLSGEAASTIGPLVLKLIEELNSLAPNYRSAVRALIWLIMVELKRISPAQERVARHHSLFPRIAPALDHVAEHYAEPLRVCDLARVCRMSEPHFRRVFFQATGKSPQTYWLELRLQMACSLLRSTSLSILAASQQAGFETLSSFNRAFQKSFSTSPRDWRRSP